MECEMEIPKNILERQTLCFSSYKNHELKVKLWVGACDRKRIHFLWLVTCPKEIF